MKRFGLYFIAGFGMGCGQALTMYFLARVIIAALS